MILTVRAFCQLHPLSQPSFYAWRRLIPLPDAATASFLPVRVVPDLPVVPPAATTPFEIVLPGNRTLCRWPVAGCSNQTATRSAC